jgi:hypothetical protein
MGAGVIDVENMILCVIVIVIVLMIMVIFLWLFDPRTSCFIDKEISSAPMAYLTIV